MQKKIKEIERERMRKSERGKKRRKARRGEREGGWKEGKQTVKWGPDMRIAGCS